MAMEPAIAIVAASASTLTLSILVLLELDVTQSPDMVAIAVIASLMATSTRNATPCRRRWSIGASTRNDPDGSHREDYPTW